MVKPCSSLGSVFPSIPSSTVTRILAILKPSDRLPNAVLRSAAETTKPSPAVPEILELEIKVSTLSPLSTASTFNLSFVVVAKIEFAGTVIFSPVSPL